MTADDHAAAVRHLGRRRTVYLEIAARPERRRRRRHGRRDLPARRLRLAPPRPPSPWPATTASRTPASTTVTSRSARSRPSSMVTISTKVFNQFAVVVQRPVDDRDAQRRRPTTTARRRWAVPATPSATSPPGRSRARRTPGAEHERDRHASRRRQLHQQPAVLGGDRRSGHPQGQRRPVHDAHLRPRATDGCTSGTNDDFNPRGLLLHRPRRGGGREPARDAAALRPCVGRDRRLLRDRARRRHSGHPAARQHEPVHDHGRAHRGTPHEQPNSFCTGDVLNGGSTPIVTSFGLRKPTDTYQPGQGRTRSPSCAKQYPGYIQRGRAPRQGVDRHARQMQANDTDSSQPGTTTTRSYNDDARAGLPPVGHLLHLHARRGRRLLPAGPHQRGARHGSPRRRRRVRRQHQRVHPDRRRHQRQAATATTGSRCASSRVDAVTGAVSISGWQNMSIYANYSGATTDLQPGPGDPGRARPRR